MAAGAARAPEVRRAALGRATAFLRHPSCTAWIDRVPDRAQHAVRCRVLGNWLEELDRLFEVLIEAPYPRLVRPRSAGRERRMAERLVALRPDMVDCLPRLRGLARARRSFRYTGGLAMRADVRGGTTMTVGWFAADGALAYHALGEPVRLAGADLLDICAFYDRLAALSAAPAETRPSAAGALP